MAELFKDFTNLYPVSKTLRFELIPEGETLYYLEKNGVLENDEKRNEDYKKLKKLMDEYYRAYIDEALSNVHLSDLDRYAELYSIQNKSDEENAEFENVQLRLRTQIVGFLESGETYSSLFKKELIEKELPKFFIRRDEDLNLIKSFKGFTTMCTGFWENRKNMFSAEEKSTAIAYRIVHENLPKFMNNIRIFRLFIDEKVDCSEKLLEKAGVNALSEVFELDYFNNTLSQRGIELYNCILGGFTEDEKHKVQGINELINLHNQQTKEKKIPQLQPLYKQILSDTKSLSFLSDAFENDGEVLATVKALYDEFHEEILSERGLISTTLQNIEKYDAKGIFVKNDLTITGLSNSLFGDWKIVNEHLNSWYEENVPRKERTEEKHVEARKAYFKKLKSISLGFIEEAGLPELCCKYKACLLEKVEAVCDAYKNVEELFDEKLEENCNLITDGKSVEKIKALLDSMKDLEAVILMLSGTGEEAERDDLFYGEFEKHKYILNLLDNVFNKTRNYVTKKPYKTEKIKLTFDSPTLLDGWDRNKETSNKSVILMKDGCYYLGIMNKANNKAFENLKDAGGECYRKMDYKLLPGPNKTLPHVFFAKRNIDYYAPSKDLLQKYKDGTHKKGKKFNLEDCHALIDFFKDSIAKHPEWNEFGFSFSDTNSYRDIGDFYKEVADQGYKISYRNVSADYIDSLVNEGKLYLFKIYNKDFSPYSKGRPNLHTMYWKALFSDANSENRIYKLNGQAEVFYRKKSIPEDKKVIHPAKEPIAQRRNTDEKSLFDYDIIKDRRYTVDKFQFHVPITMNYTALGSGRINRKMREAIKNCENMHIIGIDRGERHLLYVTVIDMQGNIKEQFSLNRILSEYKANNVAKSVETDYKTLLTKKEIERQDARKQWKSIENIKELKDGYMSQVVHVIAELMIKYNAIVVMEDLNFGFKRGRQKVERQVYQKFEKALIDKLNYLVDKTASEMENTGLYAALQLTEKFESFKKMGKQNGGLFYVNAWNTSKMDPTTGFVNLLYPKYESIEKSKAYIEKFKDIQFCDDDEYGKYLTISFDYNDFTEKAKGAKTEWTICSYGKRLYNHRNKDGYWEEQELDLTEEYCNLFKEFGINAASNIKEQVIAQNSADFFRRFVWLLKMTLQIRNSETNGETDYMLSPVKNEDGKFFNSDEVKDGTLPENADANGAYNIARKGLLLVERIKGCPDEKLDKVDLKVTNLDWMKFAQR